MVLYKATSDGRIMLSGEEESLLVAEQLESARQSKIKELKMLYDADVFSSIDYGGKTYYADAKSQELLSQILSVGSVPTGMYWRDITGAANPMTYPSLQSLASEILTRGLAADTNLAEKIAAVNAATTLTDVNNVTW